MSDDWKFLVAFTWLIAIVLWLVGCAAYEGDAWNPQRVEACPNVYLDMPSRSCSPFGYHHMRLRRDWQIYGEKPCSDAGGFDVGVKYFRDF